MSRIDLAAVLAGLFAVTFAAAGRETSWQASLLAAAVLWVASLFPR